MGSAEIIRCVNFAAIKHSEQRRKDLKQTPYINHPIGVAIIITEEGNVRDDDEVIMAALLHDTVEDTDTSFEEIETEFGKAVCDIVRQVTDDKSLPYDERKRKQIETAPHKTHQAKLVKLADKLYNLRDLVREKPASWTDEKAATYFVWASQVCDGLKGTNAALEAQLAKIFVSKGVSTSLSQ